MNKENLFCYGNSKNVGELVGKYGYFGDSEEEIQQLIDSGAAANECTRVEVGVDYSNFYPKPESGTSTRYYSYFYCVDFLAAKPVKLIACPGPEAHSEDTQAYAQQQLRIILQQFDNPSLQCIYDYVKSLQTKNETAKQLFTDLQYWYNSKLTQLHDVVVSELSLESYISADVLRSYADQLDKIYNFGTYTEDFDALQDLLNEYNI